MFKNVYSLGGSNIDPNGLEIEIVWDEGAGNELTHSESGDSYLSIFGLDSEDELHQKIDGGDDNYIYDVKVDGNHVYTASENGISIYKIEGN